MEILFLPKDKVAEPKAKSSNTPVKERRIRLRIPYQNTGKKVERPVVDVHLVEGEPLIEGE